MTKRVKKYSEEEYNELNNKYLMALADADNIRKNFAKKQAELYEYKHEDIMLELLEVIDDYERASKAKELSAGGLLIGTKLCNRLSKFGLTIIEPARGEDFSSDTMEAISTFDNGAEMSGKIIDCVLVGYKYKDKIIRYPKVVVGS